MEAKRQRLKCDESVIASGSVSRPTRTFKSTFPMQRLQPGLKALLSSSSESEEEKALHRRNFLCLTRTNIFPSWSSSSSEKAEKEEAEEEDEAAAEVVVEEEYMSRRQKWRNEWRRRELPPPLPVVVKKENSEHVPWVLKKYSYGGSGNDEGGGGQRVVIIEERVKHQEYFRVHRANGHLTLQLICVDDDDDGDDVSPTLSPSKNVEDDETLGLETDSVVLEGEALDVETEDAEEVEEEHDMNEDKKGDTSRTVEEVPVPVPAVASSMPELALGSKSNGGGAGAKCWTVSSSVGRISNSDLFRMPIPTIRPIHG